LRKGSNPHERVAELGGLCDRSRESLEKGFPFVEAFDYELDVWTCVQFIRR